MKPRIPHPLRDPACNLCDIIRFGYFHQLRLLICSGVDIECRDASLRTPIMQCAFMVPEAWGVGTARNLIENGVRLDSRDKFGRNALHYACIYERIGLINVLLKAIDFDLNQSDKLGNTALHYAVMSSNTAVAQIISKFFQRYKIGAEKSNKRGYTALGEANRLGNTTCARIIEQDHYDGAIVISTTPTAHVDGGGSPLKTGIENGVPVVKELHFEIMDENYNKNSSNDSINVNANQRNYQCSLPLHQYQKQQQQQQQNRHKSSMNTNGSHLTVNHRPSSFRPKSATFMTRRDSSLSLTGSTEDRRSTMSLPIRSILSRRGSYRGFVTFTFKSWFKQLIKYYIKIVMLNE